MDQHLPAYVEEANKALERCGPENVEERERLQGIGERLALAVAALDRWARKGEAEGDPQATKAPDRVALPVGTLAPPAKERSQ